MNVKKIVTLIVLAAFGISSQAQVVSSESENLFVIKTKKPKKPKKFMLYVKAGIGPDMLSVTPEYSENVDIREGRFGYEVDFGIKHKIGAKGFYWGAELGALSSIDLDESYPDGTISYDTDTKQVISLLFTPLIGYDINAGESTTISPYIGPSIGLVDFEKGIDGLSVGANIWFNQKWALGINYKYSYSFSDHDHPNYRKIMLTGIINF